MKDYMFKGAIAAVAMATAAITATSVTAQGTLKCEPGETYVMNVMISSHH